MKPYLGETSTCWEFLATLGSTSHLPWWELKNEAARKEHHKRGMSHKSVALILWDWMGNHHESSDSAVPVIVFLLMTHMFRSSHWHSMTYQGTSIMSFINVHHTFHKKSLKEIVNGLWPIPCVKPLSGELKGKSILDMRVFPQSNAPCVAGAEILTTTQPKGGPQKKKTPKRHGDSAPASEQTLAAWLAPKALPTRWETAPDIGHGLILWPWCHNSQNGAQVGLDHAEFVQLGLRFQSFFQEPKDQNSLY